MTEHLRTELRIDQAVSKLIALADCQSKLESEFRNNYGYFRHLIFALVLVGAGVQIRLCFVTWWCLIPLFFYMIESVPWAYTESKNITRNRKNLRECKEEILAQEQELQWAQKLAFIPILTWVIKSEHVPFHISEMARALNDSGRPGLKASRLY